MPSMQAAISNEATKFREPRSELFEEEEHHQQIIIGGNIWTTTVGGKSKSVEEGRALLVKEDLHH